MGSTGLPFYPSKYLYSAITGWWLTYPSEKYDNSSVGIMTFPIYYGKIKAMFQTTIFSLSPARHVFRNVTRLWRVLTETGDGHGLQSCNACHIRQGIHTFCLSFQCKGQTEQPLTPYASSPYVSVEVLQHRKSVDSGVSGTVSGP